MKIIAGTTAIFCLALSASAFAQPAHNPDNGSIMQTLYGDQQQGQTEIVEVANPFLATRAPDEAAARPLTMKDRRTELTLGPYRRSEYARAPGASVARPGRGAVGVALSFQLGG